MAMPSPTLNALDHLRGVLVKVQIKPWVAGTAAPDFSDPNTAPDLGETKSLTVDIKATEKSTAPDNDLWETDAWLSEYKGTVSFEISQIGLTNLAYAMSEKSDRNIANGVASTSLPLSASASVGSFVSLCISVPNVSMTPLFSAPTYVWILRTITLNKCLQVPNSTIKLTREDQVFYKLTFQILQDTSITPSLTPGAVADEIGVVKDFGAAP